MGLSELFIRNHPITRRLEQDFSREQLERRHQLVRDLKHLESERHAAEATHRQTLDAKARQVLEARVALQAALTEQDVADRARWAALTSIDGAIAVARAELERSADPAIDLFIQELTNAFDETRQCLHVKLLDQPLVGGGTQERTISNAPSIAARQAAIARARAAALALRLEAIPHADVETRLHALRASLPPISPAAFEDEPPAV
jgi:hypothetical protein